MNINLECTVNVKLTDEGIEQAIKFFNEISRYAPINPEEELESKKIQNDVYCFSFEDFMKIFGGYNAIFLEDKIKSIDVIQSENEKKGHTIVKVRRINKFKEEKR